eukprot:1387627-Alexandrium_andersonii.AAC.1
MFRRVDGAALWSNQALPLRIPRGPVPDSTATRGASRTPGEGYAHNGHTRLPRPWATPRRWANSWHLGHARRAAQ